MEPASGAAAQGGAQGAQVVASGPSDKFAEIESVLAQGSQWLSGGNMPGAADKDAFESLKGELPDPRVFPHSYSWFAMVGKFSPAKQAAWK